MRTALRANASRQAVSQQIDLPPPARGWMPNVPLTSLPPDGAAILDNWVCDPEGLRPRGGSQVKIAGLGAPVETLFASTMGTERRLFAAAGSNVYEITSADTATTPLISSLRSAQLQTLNTATSGGPSVLGFNGVDLPLRFDGTSFSALSYSKLDDADPDFDPTTFIQACTYAARVFIAAVGSTSVFYTAPDTFQGALGRLELGASFPRGGTVMAVERWSHDAGLSINDYLVAVSSEGDVVVYAGTNPSDAAAWNLVGTYRTARPIGRRCLARLGGDIAILTLDGVKRLSRLTTQGSGVNDLKDPFFNVNPAMKSQAAVSKDQYGWGAFVAPDRGLLLVNGPRITGASVEQYVMRTGQFAWSRWLGLNALSWVEYDGGLYFGDANGRVMQADIGFSDDGKAYTAALVGGFKPSGRFAQVKLARARLMATVDVSPVVGVCADYRIVLPGSDSTEDLQDVARFDFARFDLSRWASGRFGAPHQEWGGAEGTGQAFAPALAITMDPATADGALVRLVGFSVLIEQGGML